MSKQNLFRASRSTSVLFALTSLVAFSLPSLAAATESCRPLNVSQLATAVSESDRALGSLKDNVIRGVSFEALVPRVSAPDSMRTRIQMLVAETNKFITAIGNFNLLEDHRQTVTGHSRRSSHEDVSNARRVVRDFIAYLPRGEGSFTPELDAQIVEARRAAAAFMRASDQVIRHNQCLRILAHERVQVQRVVSAVTSPVAHPASAIVPERRVGQTSSPCRFIGPHNTGQYPSCISSRAMTTAPAVTVLAAEPAAPVAGAANGDAGVNGMDAGLRGEVDAGFRPYNP